MTLSAKTSRRITVDGDVYRWQVISNIRSDTVTTLYAHIDSPEHGQTLKATFLGAFTVFPSFVADVVRTARKRGWDPRQSGTFHFKGG